MKNFKFFLIAVLTMALFTQTYSFAQSSLSSGNNNGISIGQSITLPDGSILQGMTVSADAEKNNPITGAALLTSNCPTPVWDAQGAGGKTKPCNSACFLLQVKDSTGTGGLGGHSNPGWQVEIGPMDGQQCTQNNVEIWINGTKSYQIGSSAGCTGSCVWLGTLSSWFGAAICGNLQKMIISSSYFGPLTTVEIKVTDSGNNGSYAWVMRDLATAGIAGSGTWNFASGTGTTGVHSKSTTGIGKGTATFTSLSCPPGVSPCPPTGSFIDGQNGIAQFCPSASGVKPGKYAFRYSWNDGIGCNKSSTDTITITTNNNPAWSPSGTICVGQQYNLTNFITGDVGGTWSGTDVTSGGTFTPTTATTYTVTYTVGTGNCATSSIRTVTASAQPTVTATASPSSICASGATSVTLSAGGATNYTWSGGLGSTSSITVSPSSTTTYTVTGSNAGGCSNTKTVTVTINPQPTVSKTSVDIKCNGNSTGSITITPASGTSPYTFAWSNSSTTQNLTSISAGTYAVTITDNKGCTITTSATLTEPASPISVPTPTSTATGCGTPTGTASVSGVSGGTPTYSYNWSGGKTGASITGLNAGTYTLTVTDANNCSSTATATVANPSSAPVISILSQKNLVCNGNTNGNIFLNVPGSNTYSWSTGSTNDNITGLSAGTYTVTVTDNNSCSATSAVQVTEPSAYNMAPVVTNLKCKGDKSGSIGISPTGNNPGYTYDWTPGGKSTEDITGLAAGVYTLDISDTKGCTGSFTYTISEPSAVTLSASATNTSCGASTGTATASGSGGTGSLTYSWDNGSTTASLSNLGSGTYNVTVTDANGCSSTSVATVGNANGPTATASKTDASCGQNDGTATASATGGTGALTYLWSNLSTSATINNLAAGTYSVVVADANGCTSTASVVITGTSNPVAGLTASKYIGDSPLVVDFTNTSTGGTTYTWYFGDGSAPYTGTTPPTHTYSVDGKYYACVVASAGAGCKDSTCKDITVSGFKIAVPNIITPNGDKKNDVFVITTKGVTKLDITIWDRWGLQMWEGTGLTPDAVTGFFNTWEGKTTSGKECPDGTYYYMLKAYKFDGDIVEDKGFISLVR